MTREEMNRHNEYTAAMMREFHELERLEKAGDKRAGELADELLKTLTDICDHLEPYDLALLDEELDPMDSPF